MNISLKHSKDFTKVSRFEKKIRYKDLGTHANNHAIAKVHKNSMKSTPLPTGSQSYRTWARPPQASSFPPCAPSVVTFAAHASTLKAPMRSESCSLRPLPTGPLSTLPPSPNLVVQMEEEMIQEEDDSGPECWALE